MHSFQAFFEAGAGAAEGLLVLLALYVVQLVVACFLFAIDRAWELLGGSKSRLFFLPRRQQIRISEERRV
jgi:hypothetical protein